MKLRAAVSFYAALILALGGFAGSALAGDNGHGNGNGNGNNASTQSTSTSSGGDNSNGVKPSNTTQHDTHAAASSDKTKKYGNGKTAGQIATQAGYGNSTLHGPGNSQPHKVNCGGHEVDVHALKNKKCGDVAAAKHEEKSKPSHETHTTTTPAPPAPKPEHKVTICHKTGSATNPYVEITVDEHALKNGHTAAKGDIIPAPAGGCPTAQVQSTTTTQATTTEAAQSCTETKNITEQVVVGVKHFTGPKGSGHYVIIHPNAHSSHYRDKHPDELIYQTVTKTETVKSACPSTTTEVTTTTAAPAAAPSTPAAPATPASPSSPAAPTATPAGGVLGAVTALHPVKAKPAGGVLGTTVRLGKKVGGTTLPFTGLPLWIFALVAAGLILVGATARRVGSER